MDIFLLLPSCGWCVNSFYFIFLFSFSFFFSFSGCGFKISFSFSWVASLGIRVILPLVISSFMIQFPPEMDENWVRYGLAKLGQISKLPNWQRMLFCAYTTQLLHSTGEVCWNNNDSYFIWFEFVCRNSGQIASRRSWKRSCLGLEYTSKCSRLALLWEPN